MSLWSSRTLPFVAVAGLLATGVALTGPFSVSPLRIELSDTTRDAVFTIFNEGAADLDVQVRLMAWSQDGTGQDTYAETQDVLVFPQILKIPPGEERFVRVTHRLTGPFDREGTFRLFAEELPSQADVDAPLRFALQVSVPVLLQANIPRPSVVPAGAEQRERALHVAVHNDGNRHARVGAIKVAGYDAAGAVVLEAEGSGWYVLSGVQRSFAVDLPAETCERAVRFVVTVQEETTGEHVLAAAAAEGGCVAFEQEQAP